MNLRISYLVLFVAICLGCATKTPIQSTDSPERIEPKRRITDDLERVVILPVKVNRIVSLAPSATEMVYAVGAGDRLVGVTTFCNYPEEALAVAKVGDTMNPNMETIVALKPDIVLVSTASQIENFTKTLEQNGIAVFVMNPESFYGVIHNLKQLSTMFGTDSQSANLIEGLTGRFESFNMFTMQRDEPQSAFEARVRPVRTFVQISKEPLFTIGKGSLVTDIVSRSGGKSLTADIESAYPKLSKETAATLNPDAIILSESDDNREPNEVFKNSPAVKSGRVLKVNADILSRPGPRLIDAMEQIAKFLHPEKFK
ncbi:MAG: cobalamin-binding protein [Blastocatellia bacterium]|nr:cobalamin-binding protein [Blastocatellia bacterium]